MGTLTVISSTYGPFPMTDITFEDLGDGSGIRDHYPNIYFEGGWVVGDFRTGEYNGRYPPRGRYTSHGYNWATAYAEARIDVVCTKFGLLTSNEEPVIIEAYDSSNNIVDSITSPYTTGAYPRRSANMHQLEVVGNITYILVKGTPNYYLIDDVYFEKATCAIKRDEGIYSKDRYCYVGEGIITKR